MPSALSHHKRPKRNVNQNPRQKTRTESGAQKESENAMYEDNHEHCLLPRKIGWFAENMAELDHQDADSCHEVKSGEEQFNQRNLFEGAKQDN